MIGSNKSFTLLFALSLLAIGLAATVANASPDRSARTSSRAAAQSPWATDHVMVRLTADGYARSTLTTLAERGDVAAGAVTGLGSLDATLRDLGVTRISRTFGPCARKDLAADLGLDRVFRCDVPVGTDIPAAAARLNADAQVEIAAPDRYARLAYVPNDPTYSANWGHDNTAQLPAFDWYGTGDYTGSPVGTPGFDADTDMAWDLPTGFGALGLIIAIIDTGVDPAQTDLTQVTGWDFGDNDSNPADDSAAAGHGTCCAGIAAARPDNYYVAAGVAGSCAIMPLKVADTAGNLLLSNAAAAITYAANNGARVISMSFSTANYTSDPYMDPAILYAAAVGVVMVGAAGNDNNFTVDYPANQADVIAVGAASPCGDRKRSSSTPSELYSGVLPDPNGFTCDAERGWGSNYGAPAQDAPNAIDVLAPTALPTTDVTGAGGWYPGDIVPHFDGTSCSAPYVAGICALILTGNPLLTPQQVRGVLVSTCTDVVNIESTPGWDQYAGYGLVNANMAVQMALAPTASFMAAPVSGCQPLMVNFTDQSIGLISSWQWDFGDGGMDYVPSPVYVYNQPGTYTVSLTVTGPGGVDTMTLPNLITVNPVAVPDFSATVTSGFAPLTTTFIDLSLGSPADWQWDFGDGEHDDVASPTHIFQAPGFYTVSLAVANPCGGDVMVKPDYIAACDTLVADFDQSATSGVDTLTVVFTNQSRGAPVTAWSWDFGDGDTSDEASPVHFYDSSGVFTVRLIAETPCELDTLTVVGAVTVGTTSDVVDAPRAFALDRNIPNPFNPSTRIIFNLEREGTTRLEIFDAAGRRVDVLVDGVRSAGEHEVVWQAARQPSGVYFAKLTSGGKSAIRAMMLVK